MKNSLLIKCDLVIFRRNRTWCVRRSFGVGCFACLFLFVLLIFASFCLCDVLLWILVSMHLAFWNKTRSWSHQEPFPADNFAKYKKKVTPCEPKIRVKWTRRENYSGSLTHNILGLQDGTFWSSFLLLHDDIGVTCRLTTDLWSAPVALLRTAPSQNLISACCWLFILVSQIDLTKLNANMNVLS